MKLAELKTEIESYAFNERRKELSDSLDSALAVILEHTEIERVGLFGSYFTPKLQPNDVDIIVQTKDCLPSDVMYKLEYLVTHPYVHLKVMGGALFDSFSDWSHAETVVID